MQRSLLTVLFAIVAVGLASCAPSDVQPKPTAATQPAATAPTITAATAPAAAKTPEQRAQDYKKSADKRAREALETLTLGDPAKETKVRDLIVAYIPTLMAWQDQHAAQIKDLWTQWKKARSDEKDQSKADVTMSQIDAVYATFKPQHDAFWTNLAAVLSPEQVDKVKDRYTVNKLPVTYKAYLAIFPILTDKQKAFTLANLQAAREESLDAATTGEKSDFFKKYKLKIEAQFEREGIDTRKFRQEFSAKQKQQAATRKAASKPATQRGH